MRTTTFLLLIVLCATTAPGGGVARAADTATFAPPWQRTHAVNVGTDVCFDATTPGQFYTNSVPASGGTYLNNWRTGQNQLIQMRSYDACSEGSGDLFALNPDGTTAIAYNARNPTGRALAHYPNLPSLDGSVWYSFGAGRYESAKVYYPMAVKPTAPGHLFVTSDAGATWAERGAEFGGTIDSVQLVGANPRALYILVRPVQVNGEGKYVLYFSGDAGATWEKRVEGSDPSTPRTSFGGSPFHTLSNSRPGLFSLAGSADVVMLGSAFTNAGPYGATQQLLSVDGGRTFMNIGSISTDSDAEVYATPMGLVRRQLPGLGGAYALSFSSDGGHTFSPLTLPFSAQPAEDVDLTVAAYAPNYLILGHCGDMFVSKDSGRSWTAMGAISSWYPLNVSVTTPPTLIAPRSTGTYALDLAPAMSAPAATGMMPMRASASAITASCLPAAPESPFASPAFQTQWQGGDALSPNFWGPTVTGSLRETYREIPGGQRTVQYFDKGRMESAADGTVTNGLLATELITGQMQTGDATFTARPAAAIPVAGDPENVGPTYAQLGTTAKTLFDAAPQHLRYTVTTTLDATGATIPGSNFVNTATIISTYDSVTQHNVPGAFTQYRDQVGVPTIGYAKSEPFLTKVKVGGMLRQVMVQVFERRVLTFTPDNPDPYKVEMDNIGQHYYQWRYCS